MARETKQKTIDGLDLELPQLAAWDGTAAFMRLLKLAGPLLPMAIQSVMKQKEKQARRAMIAGMLTNAAPELLAKVDVDGLLELAKLLLKDCKVRLAEGKPQVGLLEVFDQALAGRYLTVGKLFAWALEVHFSGFFKELAGAAASLPDLVGSPAPESSSTKTSESSGPASA